VIGYALPLQADEMKHLLVFKDGEMCIIEPYSDAIIRRSDRMEEEYKHKFGASPTPLVESRSSWKSIPDAVQQLRQHGIIHRARVLDTNTSTDKIPVFNDAFDTAISVGMEKKQQREHARRQTMRSFMDKLDQTLFKGLDQPHRPGQTPGEPPPHNKAKSFFRTSEICISTMTRKRPFLKHSQTLIFPHRVRYGAVFQKPSHKECL
jgi:hypothetical protein